MRVWAELCKISHGETRSYKDIAVNIGDKNATRAVGGYSYGEEIKRYLLGIDNRSI